jgi:hypothetical protein
MTAIYQIEKDLAADDPTRLIIEETARESAFAFKPVDSGSGPMVEFHRFDFSGVHLGTKTYPLREFAGGILARKPDPLYALVFKTLAGYGGNLRNAFLLLYPVNREAPEAVLQEENYREFSRLRKRIAEQLT